MALMGMWFISQTPLSQDDEMAMMAGYAAAMDASMSESSSTQDVTTAIASGTSTPPEMSEPTEGPRVEGRPPEDWESQTGEEQDNASLSMCVSEASCKKSRGEKPLDAFLIFTGVLLNLTILKRKIMPLQAELDLFWLFGVC